MKLFCKSGQAFISFDAYLRTGTNILESTALQATLITQFLFQIGILITKAMIVNLILEKVLKVCDITLLI
jgi:hypothetical protein